MTHLILSRTTGERIYHMPGQKYYLLTRRAPPFETVGASSRRPVLRGHGCPKASFEGVDRRAAAQEILDGRDAEVTTCATGAIPNRALCGGVIADRYRKPGHFRCEPGGGERERAGLSPLWRLSSL
jgi:hypothetical protein